MAERQPPPSLLGLGQPWTRVGYGVAAIIVLAFVLMVFVNPVKPYSGLVPSLVGYKNFPGNGGGILLKATPLAALTVFLYIFGALAAFVWTFADIIDRQRRFVWLLPLFICPLMGLHIVPFALYLFFGRETLGGSTNVK
ncbi:hypothetical protein EON82_08600 [bacterium]|nr:MAG: hypothetical protein EON82_08600 [bacterium]